MVERDKGYIKIVKKTKNSDKFSRTFSNKPNFMRRQDAPKVYEMNASIYIFTRNSLIKKESLKQKNIALCHAKRQIY